MLRIAFIAAGVLGALVLAACQSRGVSSPVPSQCIPNCKVTSAFPTVPASKLTGNPTNGKAIFASQGCGNCHTLAAAHSNGTVGPNLDQLKPDYHDATAQVTNGGSPMPAYKGTLTTQQIADVAAYVVTSTGGNP